MNSNKSFLMMLAVILCFSFTEHVKTQDYTAGDIVTLQVNDFSLIESNHAPVSLNLSATVAGAAVTEVSNSDMFLKISSIVPGGTNREITARIASGVIPTGTYLKLQAAPCTTANSGGRLGETIPTPILLSDLDQDLVLNIGSCYTGTGYNDGYQLTFIWGPDIPETNYHLIEATESPTAITVVFTITAHDGN
ncbi:MAG: hypothetical protein HN936_02435 [Bacteroidetes bacterium]|nr:hypothetical protein [Bacteroidota bacterium]MBT4398232.1 hypothetical protein [Bacteroidota bacterium]MBT5426870.1 hypothetical protein [Bacteroidota bacterium]MBT7092074.1 hypothetical protein [Bacteroidota bacterium]MBT7463795.1 hypothetical protein [Bacteroidota bacterium]